MATHELKAAVRWADGTYDSQKACSECGLETCPFPVHPDYYKEISSVKAKKFDAETNISEGDL